ncbi:hypothetical protein TVAG_266980 [Trichomonas vaginalis G3]|uniref:Uncharacterized protein n=1 Tax=Trichomonas vaginalis (strain ATCC PRA-98 / G3) TaxID=412133 RepID=A2DQQ1_TRIV3|nr:hypothetical protein TVAGG3_0589920 [Trichomonas vaginalis G3]EAY17335.1 hypothetical protein TVAG_266980 [Trichomonas vaginalis G3]KAI5523175.1 hypothetical protein TVAGG3_0589920 [Trichomonas vaginalis G3]|eukprot:XP_001329558.1 hypothetical protein [Trichomonas vaginalis G3]
MVEHEELVQEVRTNGEDEHYNVDSTSRIQLRRLTKKELMKMLDEMNIPYTTNTTKEVLISMILGASTNDKNQSNGETNMMIHAEDLEDDDIIIQKESIAPENIEPNVELPGKVTSITLINQVSLMSTNDEDEIPEIQDNLDDYKEYTVPETIHPVIHTEPDEVSHNYMNHIFSSSSSEKSTPKMETMIQEPITKGMSPSMIDQKANQTEDSTIFIEKSEKSWRNFFIIIGLILFTIGLILISFLAFKKKNFFNIFKKMKCSMKNFRRILHMKQNNKF